MNLNLKTQKFIVKFIIVNLFRGCKIILKKNKKEKTQQKKKEKRKKEKKEAKQNKKKTKHELPICVEECILIGISVFYIHHMVTQTRIYIYTLHLHI